MKPSPPQGESMAPTDNTNIAAPTEWKGMQSAGLVCGVLALLGLFGGNYFKLMGGSMRLFYQAWLYGWIFFMAITLGCLIFQVLTNLVRATWGFPILRLLEAGAKLMPYMGILFLPIIFNAFQGADSIYPWANHTAAMADPKMANRYAWMNPGFWAVRNVIYFAFFSAGAYILSNMSHEQDRTRNARLIKTRMAFSAYYFLFLVIIGTFAYVDWVMSLDAHWYSTIYPLWFMAGAALTGLSLMAIIAGTLYGKGHPYYSKEITRKVSRDWGNLMLTLCMVWAYFSLSQFLITWSGNLPEEITYYIQRNNGTTAYVTTFLVLGMFFIPFMLLLTDETKTRIKVLRYIAIWIFCMRILEAFWNLVPFFQSNLHTELVSQLNPSYLFAWVAVGGLWVYWFFANATKSSIATVEYLEENVQGEAVHA